MANIEFLATLPSLIRELVQENITVTVETDGWRVQGFYKEESVLLVPQVDDTFLATLKRTGEHERVHDLYQMAALNAATWVKYRHDKAYSEPDFRFKHLLLRYKYIQPVTITTYEPVGNW